MECVAAAVDEVEVAVALAPPEPVVMLEVAVSAFVPTAKATKPTIVDDSNILCSSTLAYVCFGLVKLEPGDCRALAQKER